MNPVKHPFETPHESQGSVHRIPESELVITFARSSGPGGQKVNKTSSKAVLRWNVERSGTFSAEQKQAIKQFLQHRLTNEGEVVMASDQFRSQSQNKTFIIDELHRLMDEALTPEKERISTKPTRSSKERRLEEKKRQSMKKGMRRWEE